MADLAITGLVFPLPDSQNAVAPTGRRWSKGWRSADPPWPCPVWLPRQLAHAQERSRMVGRIGWAPATAHGIGSSRRYQVECGVVRRPKERRHGDLRGLRRRRLAAPSGGLQTEASRPWGHGGDRRRPTAGSSEEGEGMLEQWDLWFPAVGATGLSFARSEVDAEAAGDRVLVHAAPPKLDVTVRDETGKVIAEGRGLE